MKCCICGKEIEGYGNNPCGSIGQDEKEITWEDTDRCCDECNLDYVIPGRLALLIRRTDTVTKVPNK